MCMGRDRERPSASYVLEDLVMPRASAVVSVSLATTLIASAWGQNVISARPGTISYVEGQASLGTHSGGESLNNRLAGTVSLGAGETIETTNGRAEVQLTPSIFLRVGQNSIVKMVSPSLIHTVIEVQRGRAEVEADRVFEQNDVRHQPGKWSGRITDAGSEGWSLRVRR